MVQAAVAGAYDFSRSDWRRPRDRVRLVWTMEELDRQNEVKLLSDLTQHLLTHLARNPGQQVQLIEKLGELLENMEHLRRPWIAEQKADRQSLVERMTNQWESIWGDMDDPETQAKIASTVAYLRRNNKTLQPA